MARYILPVSASLLAAVLTSYGVMAEDNPVDLVNCFIGTGGDGHCFPAAAYPFGLVQAGPDTGWGTWDYCSGYRYEDGRITMFSQTHNPGGGCPDYADVGIMPFIGDATNVVSTFLHENETATHGYYAVTLDRGGIRVEIAAAEHSAIYRIRPARPREMRLLVDLDYGMGNLTWAKKTVKPVDVRLDEGGEIRAHLLRNGFVKNRHIGVAIRCHPAPVSVEQLPVEPGVHAPKYVFSFNLPPDGQLFVNLGLSTTDGDGAARNLEREIPAWDFDAVRFDARAKWNDILSRVSTECSDGDVQTLFATSLYHMFLVPTNIADVDGRYRGADGKVAVAPTGRYYSELSLWDTFRGAHPFYTIAAPEYVPHFVNSMLDHFDAAGYLPVLPKWGQDSQCMIGTHAVAVVADAFMKGFKGVDWRRAYSAVRDTLRKPHDGRKKEDWHVLDRYGYYPCDMFKGEGVSRTLECSYDDWCASKMAEAMGELGDAEFFRKRSENWRNVFDAESGFMRGRLADGSWRTPFDPYRCGHESSWNGDFTEGNAWQWRWHVLQDPEGLVVALGGREKAASLLDELFALPSNLDKTHTSPDVTGLWGQYVHGNEPSHHIPYLYQYAGQPDRAAERIGEICRRFYRNAPDGLCGNEDHGEMSAWYVFACLGFYPLNPSCGEFVIGAPQVAKATIKLHPTQNANSNCFAIIAKNLSKENKYVKSVKLNGKPLDGFILSYRDIMAGGELVFEMGASVEFSTPFGDGMVLQRGRPVPVWGKAFPGDEVAVRFAEQEKTATADAEGRWRVNLDPMPASTEGRTLAVECIKGRNEGSSQIVSDVLVGEVWIVSGQSNCELPLVGRNPHFSERQGILIANMTHRPLVRFAKTETAWSAEPRHELRKRAEWRKCIPENLRLPYAFSAMGICFALDVFAETGVPIGLVGAYLGSTNIEPWIPRAGFDGVPGAEWCRDWQTLPLGSDRKKLTVTGHVTTLNRQPSVLWNEMVAPWAPMAVRGVLWYQGCSNSSRGKSDGSGDWYRRMMHALYDSWSRAFENPGMRLYFAQLAPFDDWWDIQTCQSEFAAEEPNAAMVTTCDIGNAHDVHPNEKATIGKRLAALALRHDYGFDDLVADAPVLRRCVADGETVRLDFSDASGWWLYNANWSVDVPFEIADESGVWHKARLVNTVNGLTNSVPWKTKGAIDGGGTLVLAAEGVLAPVAVRHLRRRPWMGFLYSTDSGLPLGPFEAKVIASDDIEKKGTKP